MAAERPGWTSSRKGTPQNWQSLPAGRSGLSYTCAFGRSGLLSELFFGDPDPAVNEARFLAAEAMKADLQAVYGEALSFEPLAGRKGSRLADRRPGTIEQVDAWDDYIDWFVDAQTRLRAAIDAIGGVVRLAEG